LFCQFDQHQIVQLRFRFVLWMWTRKTDVAKRSRIASQYDYLDSSLPRPFTLTVRDCQYHIGSDQYTRTCGRRCRWNGDGELDLVAVVMVFSFLDSQQSSVLVLDATLSPRQLHFFLLVVPEKNPVRHASPEQPQRKHRKLSCSERHHHQLRYGIIIAVPPTYHRHHHTE